ncbi:MAG: ABC transporter substrate-binding protein [Thermomicrobiales bacterium]
MDQAPGAAERQSLRLTRRAALRLLGGVGATALLAACGNSATPTTTSATSSSSSAATSSAAASTAASTTKAATSATSSAAGGAAASSATTSSATKAASTAASTSRAASSAVAASPVASPKPAGEIGKIVITNSGAKLPTNSVTFRWIDSGDLKSLFYKKYFAAYHEAHSNITVQYDALPWAQINNIVPLGVQNGNAHDCFALPQTISAGQAVSEGWVAPLDDIIPNFQEWKARFPFGAFIEGVHVFNGKTYTFPVTSSKRYGHLLLYNTDYMQQAGYDPVKKPVTWDEFRAAAKKLTQQGKGNYYGFIIGGKDSGQFGGIVSDLARMAGASASGDNINWKTGEYNFTADEYQAAIDLLLALKSDNSVFPGSLSLNGPEARSRMPQGVAAMILEGPWNIPQWPTENANFKFEVASQPIPNNGNPVPLTYEETGANQEWVYAKSKLTAIAGDMFSYIGSEEGQVAIAVASQGNLRPIFPKANETALKSQELDPHARRALDLFEQQVRLGPMPQVRNPDENQVYLELKHLHPDFGEIVQGIYTGQISNAKAAVKDLNDKMNAELDRAIKAAQGKGAKVSRNDFIFPNWDPTKDYTKEDYQALK